METGTIGTIKWTFDKGTLTLEPQNGNEGHYKNYISTTFKEIAPITNKIETKGVLHFSGISLREIFSGFEKLETADLSAFETSKAIDISGMFEKCVSLKQVNLSSFDTGNVENMNGLFYGCESLTEVDISNFNTQNTTYITSMFRGCKKLCALDLPNFDTNKLVSIASMFAECNSLTNIDLSHFNTSKVNDMGFMFFDCRSLTELNLSNFDTSNVTDMSGMFNGCNSLTSLDLPNFDTAKVTSFRAMFSGCYSLNELDISNFCIGKSANVFSMFNFAHLSVLNMENVKSDVDFCLTELSIAPRLMTVSNEIEKIAKQISNPFILRFIHWEATYCSFNKSFIEKMVTALDTTTTLDLKSDLALIKKTPKKDLTLALYKAVEHADKDYNERMTDVLYIMSKHNARIKSFKGLNEKQTIEWFKETGLASDINTYLSGVPLEDILA